MALPGFSSPCTSLDIPFFWRFSKSPYPEKLMPLPTIGIVLILPMEKLGNCHNVFSQMPARSKGESTGRKSRNNITSGLSQYMARP
jgi:hypothetical protein